jgi:hypothetical protein
MYKRQFERNRSYWKWLYNIPQPVAGRDCGSSR